VALRVFQYLWKTSVLKQVKAGGFGKYRFASESFRSHNQSLMKCTAEDNSLQKEEAEDKPDKRKTSDR
jgi:hypothetical protein